MNVFKKTVVYILLAAIIASSIGFIPISSPKQALAYCGENLEAAAATVKAAVDAGVAGEAAAASLPGGGYPVIDVKQNLETALAVGTMWAHNSIAGGQLAENVIAHETFCWKEFLLDTAFYLLNNVVIEQMTASIVNWINGGFKGSPQFTLDLQKTLADVEQAAFGGLVQTLNAKTGKDFGLLLCTNFSSQLVKQFQVELTVGVGSGKNAQSEYWKKYQKCDVEKTLTDLGSSLESFGQDFRNGGWPAWLRVVQPNNNRYGAYVGVRGELARRLEEAKFIQNTELGWGKGFLSWKKCTNPDGSPADNTPGIDFSNTSLGGGTADDTPGIDFSGTGGGTGGVNFNNTNLNRDCKIVTPGSVVEDQLNQALGSGRHRIEIADEVNEIIGALLSQLMNQVFGEGGLLGASKSSSGQKSYTNKLANSTESVNYLKSVSQSHITQTLSAVDSYSKMYTSVVAKFDVAIKALQDLLACYQQNPSANAARINQTNQKIIELQSRKAEFATEEQAADQAVQDLANVENENDMNKIVEALSNFSVGGYTSVSQTTSEIAAKTKDLDTVIAQAQADLAVCRGGVSTSGFDNPFN